MKLFLERNALTYILCTTLVLLFTVTAGWAQRDTTIAAGPEYAKPRSYTKWWGERYRKEWTTPVKMPVVYLDTVEGGLKIDQVGGGKQTLSLRLKDKKGREWALRSVNKEFARTAPEMLKGTFVEDLIADLAPLMHPYAPLTVPTLAKNAGIYYAPPRLMFIPYQATLDTLNKTHGNRVYWLEPRPDGDWSTAANFGNSEKIIGTTKLLEKMREENDHRLDQKFYVKTRLFDMLIADWDRHEDQWRWAGFKQEDGTLYKPVPRDRDMVYSKFEGFLLKAGIKVAQLFYLESFSPEIKDVTTFNFEERNMDRYLANETTLEDWLKAAAELQAALTDTVITTAVKQLPPEVFNASGPTIIHNLKERRNKLDAYARDYFLFLAKEVEVVGSEGPEYFAVERLDDKRTSLSIYNIRKNGDKENKPFYSRVFDNDQTKELRIYGLDGKDVYTVQGDVESGMRIRLIAGVGKDSIVVNSKVSGGGKQLHIYDNPGNVITANRDTRVHIKSDTAINSFQYYGYHYNREGFRPMIFYSNQDRLYVGLNYTATLHKWRKAPFSARHKIDANYSISQKAPSITYRGIFPQRIGRWGIVVQGYYDWVRWMNFYGLGNETKRIDTANRFYRNRMREWGGIVGIDQEFEKKHHVNLSGFVTGIKVLKDSGLFFYKLFNPALAAPVYEDKQFGGAHLLYNYNQLDNDAVPTRGFAFSAKVTYTQNLKQKDRSFFRFDSHVRTYLPITSHLVLSVRGGASTVEGEAEYYQLPWIGGAQTFRGFRRERFFGKTAVYNNNELQWEIPVKARYYSGKIGFLALFDNGRVWLPGEKSNTWHTAVGGGIMLAPLNMVMASVTYAVSSDGSAIQIRLIRDL